MLSIFGSKLDVREVIAAMTPEAKFAVIKSEVLFALADFYGRSEKSGKHDVMRAFLLQPVPHYGTIYFSFLTTDEPDLVDSPNRYGHGGNWRHSSFWAQRQHSPGFAAFEKWMDQESSKPGRVAELVGQLLPICTRVLNSPEVTEALGRFELTPDFEVASSDNDDGRFNYCNIS